MTNKAIPVVLLENCTGEFAILGGYAVYYVHAGDQLWAAWLGPDGLNLEPGQPADGYKLAAHCTVRPHLDGESVFFGAGTRGLYRMPYLVPPNRHEPPVWLDDSCASEPLVHESYVYFCGASSGQQLHRVRLKVVNGDRVRDGVEDLHAACMELGFVHHNWLYYRHDDELFRMNLANTQDRKKIAVGLSAPTLVDLGQGRYQMVYRGKANDLLLLTLGSAGGPSGDPVQLDEYCYGRPSYHGGYVYFCGYKDRLYRRACSGSVPSEPLVKKCEGMPIATGTHVYYRADGKLFQQPLAAPRKPGHDWMSQMKEDIGERELWQIALPGAHDAGCYDEFWVSRDRNSHWDLADSKAQGKRIGKQLRYGIRYFDLRFTPNPTGSAPQTQSLKQYSIFHGPHHAVVTLDDVVGDVADFLKVDKDRREILILDLRADGLSKEEELFVIGTVCERIGRDRIVSRSAVATRQRNGVPAHFPAHCTPNELYPRQVIILWWGGYDRELSAGRLPAFRDADYVWFYSDARNVKTSDPVIAPDFSDSDHAYFQVRLDEYNANTEDALESSMKWWTDHYQAIQTNSHFKYWLREGLGIRPSPSSLSLFDWAEATLRILIANLQAGGKWNKADVYHANGVCEQHTFPWGVISQDLFHEPHYTDFVEAVISLNAKANQFNYSSGRRRRA